MIDIVTYFLLKKIMGCKAVASILGILAIDPYQIGYLGDNAISVLELMTSG